MRILCTITDELVAQLETLTFGPPVTHVYNPLVYARKSYDVYLNRYALRPKEIVLVGMNPGPWGMTQTGVPFGEVRAVKNWLGIQTEVGVPQNVHPKRPVTGFSCEKSEVSGKRLWGWAMATCGSPEIFFRRFFVANYCPLLFLEASGRNRTPDHLPAAEKKPLLNACDRALRRMIAQLQPRYVIGIGNFARDRVREALRETGLVLGRITHPSPANPKANRDWGCVIEKELSVLGIQIGNEIKA
ncbi:MAG: uracil-DNA glycosylase family protein [Desulfobacterales bacterium]